MIQELSFSRSFALLKIPNSNLWQDNGSSDMKDLLVEEQAVSTYTSLLTLEKKRPNLPLFAFETPFPRFIIM
jgi:hypothetical protein